MHLGNKHDSPVCDKSASPRHRLRTCPLNASIENHAEIFGITNLPAPAFLFFFETRSSAAKEAMFFILACAAALFRSDKAAFRRRRSFILVMITYGQKVQRGHLSRQQVIHIPLVHDAI
jgi:hypothetical protein